MLGILHTDSYMLAKEDLYQHRPYRLLEVDTPLRLYLNLDTASNNYLLKVTSGDVLHS